MSSFERDVDDESLTISAMSRPLALSISKDIPEGGLEFGFTEFRRLFMVSKPPSTEDKFPDTVVASDGMVLKLSRSWLTLSCRDEELPGEELLDAEF